MASLFSKVSKSSWYSLRNCAMSKFLKAISTTDQPSLLLIDYNSVPENGLEVLKKIKKLQPINGVPIVILSDSVTDKYRNECYAHGASSFIKKTTDCSRHCK